MRTFNACAFNVTMKSLASGKAHAPCNEVLRVVAIRNRVRLQTVLHLQPVLECAEEIVGVRQFTALVLRYKTAVGESAETYECVRHAQPLVASTVGQL